MNLIRLPLIILCLIFSFTAAAETSIWKISNDKNTVYLGGTFHLLKPSDYPLPKEFEEVYKKVNWLVFETNLSELEGPEFQKKFIDKMTLPSGKILVDQLSPKAYSELIRYAAKNNIDTGRLQHFKPQMVGVVISIEELKKLGLTAEGVDTFMTKKAKQDGKVVSQLESVDEQIDYIANMGTGNESNYILQTLKDIEDLPEDLNDMSTAWKSGDANSLAKTGIEPMMEDYPNIYQSLLVERNNNWMPKVEKLIQHPEEKFILVGALHLVGKDGLLQQLKEKGYQVEQY